MSPSRFRHGFGKSWGFPKGFPVQAQGLCRVVTGWSRVNHGSASNMNKTIRKGVTSPGNSSEVGILAAWAAFPDGLTRFCWKPRVLNGNPGFSTSKVGKPDVCRQTWQKTRVLLVRYMMVYIYIYINIYIYIACYIYIYMYIPYNIYLTHTHIYIYDIYI